MKRGELWWASLPHPIGTRPVVLLSRDQAYRVRERVTVAPVTTRIRNIPTEVSLGHEEGLPKVCVVNFDEIITIPKKTLQKQISDLSPQKIQAIDRAVKFALALS